MILKSIKLLLISNINKMKTLIKKYENESIESLNELLKSKIGALDKTAIRTILKNRINIAEKDDSTKTPNVAESKKQNKKTTSNKKNNDVKKPGVIASIFNCIKSGPITEPNIVKKLATLFPERNVEKMKNTLKVQIGSNKRPVRMERDKKVTFEIVENDGVKTFSIKK